MRKHVYLFELDSVRKTDAEIIAGQRALYDEIVMNGNIVVLTYNQLVDSRAFFSLLRDPDYSRCLIRLFELGAIRLSQFGDIRTVSQYLLNSIEDDKQFIYSALPLRYSQKRLTALMRRCLMYSDLSEIHHYIELAGQSEKQEQEQVAALFVEMHDGRECDSDLDVAQMRLVLENLYALLETVLRISTLHDIYIPPRDPREYHALRMADILCAVMDFSDVKEQPLFTQAVELLRGLDATKQKNNNRSVYIRELQGQEQTVKKEVRQYAEAVVDLCYNYACENSICNISKHYNVGELQRKETAADSFQTDFFGRMQQYWGDGRQADGRFQVAETNEFELFDRIQEIPSLEEAVRFAEYVDYKETEVPQQIRRYEYRADQQKKEQCRSVAGAIAQKLFFALICIGIACLVEFAFNWLEDCFDTFFHFGSILGTICMLFITEAITTVLADRFPNVLALSDAVGGVGRLLADLMRIFSRKSSVYRSSCETRLDDCEDYSQGHMIGYVRSNALKKYTAWRSQMRGSAEAADSDVYPLADVNDTAVVAELLRLEEMYNYRFGIVYQSRYNRFLVDPVLAADGRIFPYERVLPTVEGGVVILTRCRGKYILLRQFRHALRRTQYAFPRGFSEAGAGIVEDVRRELQEELGATLAEEPRELGCIAPDSGLTGGCVRVFAAELSEYREMCGHEGILEVAVLSDEELEMRIRDGSIDDGFTLGAYALWCAAEKGGC